MMNEKKSLIDIVQNEGRAVTVSVGISMWPMLKNRKNAIVIEKVTKPLKKYDIPMYIRHDGPDNSDRIILHRIIRINKDGSYIIRGDNLLHKEYDVSDSDIKGVLTGFYRGQRFIDCESSKMYHAYVYIWNYIFPLRAIILILKKTARYIIRKRK